MNESTSPKHWPQLCTLYLLGEFDTQQAAEFEQRLESSPQIAEELMRQASVISALAARPTQTAHLAVSATAISRWPVVASILSIAACIALVLVGMRPTTSQQGVASLGESTSVLPRSSPSEELLIARAWADSQLRVSDDGVSDDIEFADPDDEDVVAIQAVDETPNVDSTLSWMFIAVSADSDADSSGATNDG